MDPKIRILVADDAPRFLQTLAERLSLRGFEVARASDGAEAVLLARTQAFDLALVDLHMPGMGGMEVLAELKQRDPLVEVIILTGHASIDSAVECTKRGAYYYLQKPCEAEALLWVLKNAYQRRVQQKLRLDGAGMAAALNAAPGEPVARILEKLRAMHDKATV